MKVSEAVASLNNASISGTHSFVMVRRKDLSAILKSHEALRLAGEAVTRGTFHEASIAGIGTIICTEQKYRALSLAVEEAGR